MERRNFLIGAGAALAVVSVSPRAVAGSEVKDQVARRIPLTDEWEFKAEGVVGSECIDFSDALITYIVHPHSNAPFPWHSFDEAQHTFVPTYCRTFTLLFEILRKRVFVDFQSAATSSTVYLNGTLLGTCHDGYTPFSFELTDHIRSGLIQLEARHPQIGTRPYRLVCFRSTQGSMPNPSHIWSQHFTTWFANWLH